MQEISFKNARGLKIAGTLDVPEGTGPFAGVVALHGFGGNKENNKEWSEILNPLGIAVLRIDFAGSGKSEGKFEDKTMTGFIDDATRAIDYLVGLPQIDEGRVGLVGHSAGAVTAMLVAARDTRIKTLVASVPGVHEGQVIAKVSDFKQRLNPGFFTDIEQYDVIAEAKKIPYKFLLIGARQDELVPWSEIQEIVDKVSNAVLLELPNSGHNLEADWGLAETGIRKWFSQGF